jgi:alpha-tubulin suppressor-like RCC1 family protein
MLRRLFAFSTRLPRLITPLSFVITILLPQVASPQSRAAGGDNFTLVVSDSGNVWSFGDNAYGQLGLGNTTDAKSAMQIPGLSEVVAVAAGGSHSLALTSTGDVYAWGNNQYGQIGDESNTNRWSPQLLNLSNVVAIAAGYRHSLALTDTGDLYVWGYNAQGQLGRGNTSDSNVPVLVLSGVSAIGAGFYHSLAVKTDGTAWAWGTNVFGQLGNNEINDPTYAPVQMVGISTGVAVYGGLNHSIIRLADGTLKATGDRSHGQLGDGTSIGLSIIPVSVVGLTDIQTVAVSWLHNLALDGNGAIWVWGGGGDGVLGTGNQSDVDTPTVLSAPTGISVIGTGLGHSIAIDTNGVVSRWGSNGAGELGDGTTVERWSPDQSVRRATRGESLSRHFQWLPAPTTSRRT